MGDKSFARSGKGRAGDSPVALRSEAPEVPRDPVSDGVGLQTTDEDRPTEGEEAQRKRRRRLAGLLVARGDRAGRQGDFAGAAYHFELAGAMFEAVGETLRAADAVLELGRSFLFLRLGELLPALAGRLENLALEEAATLPAGGGLALRVWATILRGAEREPTPFLQLVRERRRLRSGSRDSYAKSGVPGEFETFAAVSAILGPAVGRRGPEDKPLSVDGKWFVHVIEGGSPADRIEAGERLVALGREAGCQMRRQIETLRVVVKIAVDARGVALVRALEREGLSERETPS